MAPADQRLHPDDRAVDEVDLGLVVEAELVALERLVQIDFQRELLHCAGVHVPVVVLVVVPAVLLCIVARGVGILEQAVAVDAVERIDSDADARAQDDFVTGDVERLGK